MTIRVPKWVLVALGAAVIAALAIVGVMQLGGSGADDGCVSRQTGNPISCEQTLIAVPADEYDASAEAPDEEADDDEPERDFKITTARVAFSRTVLDGSAYGATLRGIDTLIALCREDPEAIYDPDGEALTMVQVLEDGANTLRRYRPELAAELELVAANDCQ